MQTARPTQCVQGQAQDCCRAPVTVNVLTLTLTRVQRFGHLNIRCLRSPAPALTVPCSPMHAVNSVNQMAAYQASSHRAIVCLVDHLLQGMCPNVMTLASQRREVAF